MNENKDQKQRFTMLYIMVAFALIGVITSIVMSISVLDKAKAMTVNLDQLVKDSNTEETTQENDVVIMDEYTIKSTEQISDAYKNEDATELSDRDKETLDLASAVLDKIIKDDMTDFEKEKAVYDWMTSKLQEDAGVLTVIPSSAKDSDNPYGVLKYHNAVCVGYATTFRLFMQMMDIECMVIHNSDSYHSWDLVKLDGEWYHTDVYSDAANGNYANFNLNDEMMSNTWDTSFFPAATGIKYNMGYQNAKSINDVYKIPAIIRKKLDKGKNSISFKFNSNLADKDADVIESMLSNIRNVLTSSEEYVNFDITWTWALVDNGYLLVINLYDYSDSAIGGNLTEKQQEKIENSINDSFSDIAGGSYYYSADGSMSDSEYMG